MNVSRHRGPLEPWRHALSLGGISPEPLPDAVVAGVRQLAPRLIRIFIQEFFRVYPEPGRFDWRRLDAYMDALRSTGARIVAAITLKPPVLYPTIDENQWRPTDGEAWQHLIEALVYRYSVATPLVAYWEVANETDIGEQGGSPYLIPDAAAYAEFYRLTVEAIRRAAPGARVGGPASCWVENEPLPGLVEYCRRTATPLDFISWHLYSDDPDRHAWGVEQGKRLAGTIADRRVEVLVTEWSKGFERFPDAIGALAGHPLSFEEQAYDSRVAAILAASAIKMIDAGVDWAFYYHLWDQPFNPEDFRPFFSSDGIANMYQHWNEFPHRFGLFGVNGELRPHFHVFTLLNQLGSERLEASASSSHLHVLAAGDETGVSAMAVNLDPDLGAGHIAELTFDDLPVGPKLLSVYRLDALSRPIPLEITPVEQRRVYTQSLFRCQIALPRNAVAVVRIGEC